GSSGLLRILPEYPRLIEPPSRLAMPPRRAARDRRRNRAQKQRLALSRHLSFNSAKVHSAQSTLIKPVTMHAEFDVGRSMFFALLATLNPQLFCLSLACPPY